jgi:hypothetical protein
MVEGEPWIVWSDDRAVLEEYMQESRFMQPVNAWGRWAAHVIACEWIIVDTHDQWHREREMAKAKTLEHVNKRAGEVTTTTFDELTAAIGRQFKAIAKDGQTVGQTITWQTVTWRDSWQGTLEHQGPTDAEIVEAWDSAMRTQENEAPLLRRCPDVLAFDKGPCAGATLTRDQYQAARSRELKRKQDEAREQERMRVVCEGTLPEDY